MATAAFTKNLPAYSLFFGVFLPTLVHVYVFTGLFILYGALKSRSRSGYLSLFVFIACGLIFFILSPSLLGVSENAYLRASYEPFQRMAFYFAQLLNFSDVNALADIYASSSACDPAIDSVRLHLSLSELVLENFHHRLARNIPRSHGRNHYFVDRVVGIYLVDYRVGFAILLTLSLGHVILEFPLNHQTIWGIGRELSHRLRKRRPLEQQSALTQ